MLLINSFDNLNKLVQSDGCPHHDANERFRGDMGQDRKSP